MDVTRLFEPVTLSTPEGPGLDLRNRTVLAPMCEYSVTAKDGIPHAWHMVHLGARAVGGFGLVYTEATAVSPEGRISDQDTGIWNDAQRDAWAPIVDFIHSQGAAAGIQLAHAGAKASTYPALPGAARGTVPAAEGGWQTLAPSVTDAHGLDAPAEMTVEQIQASVRDWADAARRADEAGFDVAQLHAAHGYLIHQFLSPLTNHRTDQYGGSFENRTRYAREVIAAVREVWPAHKVLGLRISGEDWVEGGWRIADTVRFAGQARELGASTFDLSSGGIGAFHGPSGPGYQVSLATAVKEALAGTDAFVTAVGMITEPAQAEHILVTGQADGVSIGRAALVEPYWPAIAARDLGIGRDENPRAPQYWRAAW
ncbi:NADH:flavin oxidoreductase/NADH oxidase [Arthrobacter sp. JSM 101049]|uniref:NADH:flavin oxidoreductase/NADH oxidase n=1 Tax=Arthrobacter sp. JSM 101049 TaxID=929097 RepID=UPI003569A150